MMWNCCHSDASSCIKSTAKAARKRSCVMASISSCTKVISKISMKIRLVTLFVIGWMMPSFCFSHVPSVFDSWLAMNSIIICLTSNVWITVYVVVHNKRDEEVITSLHDDSTAYPHSHGLDNDWCGKE